MTLLSLAFIALGTCYGCTSPEALCSQASWLDRVEGPWLIVENPRGFTVKLARSPERDRWREGDAIIDGRPHHGCRARRAATIARLRRELMK